MSVENAKAIALRSHLETGVTTVCRCWLVERKDGWVRGFTDHDEDVAFGGKVFSASSGFTASSLEATTGLAVDNSEVVGALSDAGLSDEDIEAGRFDGATVTMWQVNWTDPYERAKRFRGTIGEVSRKDDVFSAELRGLTEALNQPGGLVYQADCSAILGDSRCGFDTSADGFQLELAIAAVADARVFRFAGAQGLEEGWFTRGRLTVLDGAAAGLVGWIKSDKQSGDEREISLWQSLRSSVQTGDRVRLEAGCDKQASTCANKFDNFLNFRGCPHIPGEDWLTSYPKRGNSNDGGSMNSPIVP